MAEQGSVEYWQEKIRRWKRGQDFFIKTFGEKYYEEHLAKYEACLEEAKRLPQT